MESYLEIVSYFRTEQKLYLISPYQGQTLTAFSALVHKYYGFFPDFIIYYLIGSITKSLMLMHSKFSTAHLDIKPDNILVHKGKVIICDMGVAKTMNPSDDLNSDLPGCGTPAYAPPESGWQDNGDASSTFTFDQTTFMTTTTSYGMKPPSFLFKEQFDVYTLGVLIIQIINNKLPSRLHRVVEEERKKFYAPRVLTLIEKMVADKPENRPTFKDIDELMDNMRGNLYVEYKEGKREDGEYVFGQFILEFNLRELFDWFHDYILLKANQDVTSKLKFDDDQNAVWPYLKERHPDFWRMVDD